MPRDFSGIVGRDDEIKLILEAVSAEQTKSEKTVMISSFDGMPAVGKTTLAVRIAHLLSYQYSDAQLFVDCYGYTAGHQPLLKEQILDSLLFSLEIPISVIPEKYEDKLSLWRLELNKKSIIVVFDNVKYHYQIDELIPYSTASLFIITSRNHLPLKDTQSIEVNVLNTEASVLLLNNGAKENDFERNRLLIKLAEQYGYLPYALQIISQQIKGRGPKYIQRLLKSQNKLGNLSMLNNAVYESFDISYQSLNSLEQLLFQLLGLFPGPDFTSGSCAAMVGVDTENIYRSIDILFQSKLIKEVGDDRYTLHDLMRDFSREKYNMYHNDMQPPLMRLLHYYIECIIHCNNILYPYNYMENVPSNYEWIIMDLPQNQSEVFDWLKLEIENILACLDTAKFYNWNILYFKLSYVLAHYIIKSLSGWRVVEIYQEAVSYKELDDWMIAASLSNLAHAYQIVGEFDTALLYFEEAETLWKKVDNKKGLADTLGKHGFTLERLGRYQEALEIIEEALSYEKNLNNQQGIASILNSKGAVYWRMEQYFIAKEIFERAIQIRQKIKDEFGAANSINNLAFTLLKLGDIQKARDGFIKSLMISRKYWDYSGESVTLNNLGYTEIMDKQPSEAILYAKKAFEMAVLVGNEYQIARSYDVKGKAYLQLKNDNDAIANLRQALALFQKLNVPEEKEVQSILYSIKKNN